MSGLLTMLSLAARALDAQRFGLDVAGQNIANVNTAGYAKRVAEFAAVPPTDRWSSGGGVAIVGARAMRDHLIDRRVREELAAFERETTLSAQLAIVEVAVGAPGRTVDAALDRFFDAFALLAETPLSEAARLQVILQGESLGNAFRDVAARFQTARADGDRLVRSVVEEINDLASRIAALNTKLTGTVPDSPEGADLRDRVAHAVERLAALVDINARVRADGGFDVDLATGRPLVVGERAYALEVADDAVTGLARVIAGGEDVTARLAGGRLAGLLVFRDHHVPDYLARLDQLATEVASEVNRLHRSGFDLSGLAGGDFFQPVAGPGAAMALAVNPALLAPGGGALVAAAGAPGVPGDTSTARALASLRDVPFANGGTATPAEAWAQLVFRLGRDRQRAIEGEAMQSAVLLQIRNLQDSVSGVSLDEEAANLMRFQRAYEANARYFTVINDTLTTLLGLVR